MNTREKTLVIPVKTHVDESTEARIKYIAYSPVAQVCCGCAEQIGAAYHQAHGGWPGQRIVSDSGMARGGYKKIPIPADVRRFVFERDAYRCVSCGGWDYLTCDHITPESKGGLATPENLQTMCRSCNSKKGARDCS